MTEDDNEQESSKECDDGDSSEGDEESIVGLFDSLCVTFGDQDVIVLIDPPAASDPDRDTASNNEGDPEYKNCLEPTAVCYLELQETSLNLAAQLWYRYRPDYVLVECFGHAVAETVALLACMRIHVPFVPVELAGPPSPNKQQSRVQAMVQALQEDQQIEKAHIVAICCCDGDDDPVLGVLYQANVHRILYVDPLGNLLESIRVPSLHLSRLPFHTTLRNRADALYMLFTSGTTSTHKAVVGSHRSTFRRLAWWRNHFSASPRIARRTKLTFVDGITELLSPLLHPPSILVALTHPYRLAQQGVSVLVDMEPTQITLLPSQLGQLLLVLQNQKTECSLQRIICSGEMFPVHLWERVQRFNATLQVKGQSPLEIINLYGQTESTGDALCAVLTDMKPESVVQQGAIAVGLPIRDDVSVTLSPLGGELVVSGNLAVRYLHDTSNLEAVATGDVGFCDNSGIWYVRGRQNEVDKVNGVWTSPSEVEAAVAEVFPSVHGPIAAAVVDGRVYLVSEDGIPNFSRECMRNSGTPWNLIPHQVFRHSIPIQPSGAGKLDRRALRGLISGVLCNADDGNNDFESKAKDGNEIELVDLVGRVLDLPFSHIDPTLSFVDLGGDSATAMTLLYHLQAREKVSKRRRCLPVTAVDILAASSLFDLHEFLDGKRPVKRAKHDIDPWNSSIFPFCPSLPKQFGPCHRAIKFVACVDASPTMSQDGKHLFVGCQGGAVQKVCVEAFTIVAHRHFSGWMIQANCVVKHDSVIVSLYNRRSATGRIVSLSLDLDTVLFSVNFDGIVRATPVLLEESILCVNVGERSLRAVDTSSGKLQCSAELPEPIFSKPAVLCLNETKVGVYAGNGGSVTRATLRRDETGTTHLDTAKLTNDLVESIGSVHKELNTVPGGSAVLVSGSFGALLQVSLNTATLSLEYPKVTPISEYPLSPVGRIGNSDMVVGSYDGILHILSRSGHLSVNVGASIYCKPLLLEDGTIVVCTTAGDVVRIREKSIVWRYRVEAEIWSNPVLVNGALEIIAFGGRDSRLHILTIGGGT